MCWTLGLCSLADAYGNMDKHTLSKHNTLPSVDAIFKKL